MKIKKIIAAIAASAVAVSVMAVSAFAAQDASALADGTAYLNINNDQWGDFDAEWTNAAVTGNGTYTVSMTGADNINLAQFNALEILNGEVLFGRTYTVTVDSVKINGEEKKVAEGYTCSADEKAITTRVNLYNEWNNPSDKVSDDGYVDCRSADGDFMSKSAKIISDDDLIGVSSIEVTFTVSGIDEGNSDTGDNAADEAAESTDNNDAAASDGDTASTGTGNVPVAAMAAVMAVAGTAAVASRKRK